jgi:hypothetical protein
MSLQYVSDNEGNHTAVLIPIAEWELITRKHEDLKLLEKPKAIGKIKPSDFFGILPKDIADQMQDYIKQSRNEWR